VTEKRRVSTEYDLDPRNHPPREIDHFYPLCAGGSNDITNLWFQPATNVWDGKNYRYHEKDDLEARLDLGRHSASSPRTGSSFANEIKAGHKERVPVG
jgi:hypothetical protein